MGIKLKIPPPLLLIKTITNGFLAALIVARAFKSCIKARSPISKVHILLQPAAKPIADDVTPSIPLVPLFAPIIISLLLLFPYNSKSLTGILFDKNKHELSGISFEINLETNTSLAVSSFLICLSMISSAFFALPSKKSLKLFFLLVSIMPEMLWQKQGISDSICI